MRTMIKGMKNLASFACILTLCSFPLMMQAQTDNDRKIVFHVTAVRSGPDPNMCQTGKCVAKLYSVEGYTNGSDAAHSIEYVLKCSDVQVFEPTLHYSFACANLHANGEYVARVASSDDGFFFSDPKARTPNSPPEALFQIVSEKEVEKEKK